MGEMAKYRKRAGIGAFCLVMLLLSLVEVESAVFLWPQPQSITWGTGESIAVSSNFTIVFPKHHDLQRSVSFYKEYIREERWLPVQVPVGGETPPLGDPEYELLSLHIEVLDLSADLQMGVDESYNISVPNEGGMASLAAKTVWGAIHGLETFSQLVRVASDAENASLILEHGVTIVDKPNFQHRGLMLDTSRNFYPKKDIMRTVRAMGHNKMNVFHWHVTDSHSFPLYLPTQPDLALKGAYGTNFMYSPKDVADIVKFARQFGVRVVPEIDMPGHTASWGRAHPEIITCGDQFWLPVSQREGRFASEPAPGQLNPLNPKTYEVVKNVIDGVSELFPDALFHAGSDEVAPACWMNSTDIQQYVEQGNSLSHVLQSFISKTAPYILSHNKTVVYWADVVTGVVVKLNSSDVHPDHVILQTWDNGAANTKLTTSQGYRTIVSSSDFLYLDCGHGGWMGNDPGYDQQSNTHDPNNIYNYASSGDGVGTGGDWCSPFKTWMRIYDYDIVFNLTAEEAKLVLGAEVALWSEMADTTVLDSKLWPRTAALAESMWSGNRDSSGAKRIGEAINRLNDWRFRMVERGIGAEPLQPLWCLKHPNQCNSYYSP